MMRWRGLSYCPSWLDVYDIFQTFEPRGRTVVGPPSRVRSALDCNLQQYDLSYRCVIHEGCCVLHRHHNTFSADLTHRPHRTMLYSCDIGVVDKEEKRPLHDSWTPSSSAPSLESALRFPFLRVHHLQTHQNNTNTTLCSCRFAATCV
jgi:hypothetical protein